MVALVLALASIFIVSIPDCSDPAMDDPRCKPQGFTHVGSVESYSPNIWGLAAGPTNQLSSIKDLAMYIDMTADPAEKGVVEATFKITGAHKSSATVATFYTAHAHRASRSSSTLRPSPAPSRWRSRPFPSSTPLQRTGASS